MAETYPLTPVVGTTGYLGPLMQQLLNRYGLGGLSNWLSAAVIRGWSEEEIKLKLWDTPEFRNRFPGIFIRITKGRPPMTVDEYMEYEERSRLMTAAIGYRITNDEITQLIGSDVALPELEERVSLAATAVYDSDNETTHELGRLWGITNNEMMRYWLDPTKELPRLQQQYKMAEIAGQFRRASWGEITETQAKRLQEGGFDRERALEGARTLVQMEGLFSPIDETESLIGANEQVELLMGNAATELKVQSRAEKRIAEFQGGGTFAEGQDEYGVGKFATGSAT